MTKVARIRRSVPIATLVALLGLTLASALPAPSADAGTKAKNEGGGKAVAHYAGAKRIKSKTITRRAPKGALHRIGLDSTEPTLGVSIEGNVFMSAFQANTRVEVMRSVDRGDTWETVSPQVGGRNIQLVSLDPYIYLDNRIDGDNSRIYTIDLTVACAYLSYSDDEGESWITNPLACGRPVNDHQTLFAGPPVQSPMTVYPNVVYYCWNDVATSSCSKSLDGGITFTPSGQPAFAGGCGGLTGHGYVGDDGTIYIPKGHCGQPWLAMSKDEGATWTTVQVADNGLNGHHEAGVVADKAGNIYYTWPGADRLPYLAVSKDGGATWSDPMMIGPPGLKESNIPGIDVGAKGKVAITYMGSANSPFDPSAQGSPPAEAYSHTTWNGYMTISANVFSKKPVFYSATVNNKKDPLLRGQCGPGRCQVVYDFIDIVIDREGVVWGAFVDGCILFCPDGGPNAGSDGVVGQLVGGPRLR